MATISKMGKSVLQGAAKLARKGLNIRTYRDYIEETKLNWWGKKRGRYCRGGLSVCIDTVLLRDDSDERWQCCPYWQRKLTNKLMGREFALKYDVPVPALYWYGKNVEELPYDELPGSYVIKTSFGSGSNDVMAIVDGINVLTGAGPSREEIGRFFRERLSRVSPYGYILVEEFLIPTAGNKLPKDYKCHVFNGELVFFEVINRDLGEEMWYTRDWRIPEGNIGTGKFVLGSSEKRPQYYSDLIKYAERLGRSYGKEYVRIDFYLTDAGCVFGEFTATPSGGKGLTAYGNRLLGKWCASMAKKD